MTTTSMISAAYTQAFLDAFASLGIEPWAGIEMDVAWGQTTLRFGLHRPSVTGPIFVYRVCTALRQDTPTRMQVLSHADLSPDQLLSAIAGQHPDLRDTWADGGWQLCAIDATRGHSRDRSLMHPCYILIQADDYWVFNHRPHGLLELVLGSLDLWPIRGGNGQFLLVDPWSGNYFDLEAAKFVKPIGIFDAFSLEKKRPLKIDAASALNIQVNDVSDSLVVNQDKAKRFELTPVWAPAQTSEDC